MSLSLKSFHLLQSTATADEANASITFTRYTFTIAGLVLCALAIRYFHIEDSFQLFPLFLIGVLGFGIYALIPVVYRLPYLFILNVVAIFILFSLQAGAGILGIGLLLFIVVNLQIRVVYRVALSLVLTTILALGKLGYIPFPEMNSIATVVGGLFMFRSMVYLYEMQYEKEPKDFWLRLNYFFLLPNLIFIIFPVVDYKTFTRSYYNTPSFDIYRKGLHWIMRGLLHLMIYRIIYYYLIPAPGDINSIFKVLQYMAMSYALIIRLSGIFHLSTGIICLFGFNIPPTFDNYFLASGFSDLWRRINIYWKDFIMKVFYFPLYFKFKKRNDVAIFITVIVVFFINWLLHQYQWFWIRGNFPIRAVDLIFWLLFGVLVAFNSIYQKRVKKKPRLLGDFSPKEALIKSLKVIGMLVFMSVLWSFWTSPSIESWLILLEQGSNSNMKQVGILIAGFVGLCVLGVFLQYVNFHWLRSKKALPQFAILKMYSIGWILLVVLASPMVHQEIGRRFSMDVGPILETRLNKFDEQQLFQGYYESLLVSNNFTSRMWEVEEQKRREDFDARELLADSDILEIEETLAEKRLKPNYKIEFKGAELSTNEFGMRDRSYTIVKDEGTLRIALLGGSSEMGSGINDDETFDNIVEDALTTSPIWDGFSRVEVLNFSISGIHLPQQVGITEQRILPFDPDVFVYCVHDKESSRNLNSFSRIIQKEFVKDYPLLLEIRKKAAVSEDLKKEEVYRRLKPFETELAMWGLDRMKAICEVNKITPICLYIATLGGGKKERTQRKSDFLALFKERGFHIIDLNTIFDDMDKEQLKVTRWDRHPNGKAHQIIAKELLKAFAENEELKTVIEQKRN